MRKSRRFRPGWKQSNIDFETLKRIGWYWSRGFNVETKLGASVSTIQTKLQVEGIYLDPDTIRAGIAELMECPPSLVNEFDPVTRECLVALRPDIEKNDGSTSLILQSVKTGATVQVAVDPDVFQAVEEAFVETGAKGLGVNLEGWTEMPKDSKIIVAVPLNFLQKQEAAVNASPHLPPNFALQLAAVSYLCEIRKQETQRRACRMEISPGVKALMKATNELKKSLHR